MGLPPSTEEFPPSSMRFLLAQRGTLDETSAWTYPTTNLINLGDASLHIVENCCFTFERQEIYISLGRGKWMNGKSI